MSTETQARNVEVPGTRFRHYRVKGGVVKRIAGLGQSWVAMGEQSSDFAAAIRRIAELEEERERVRGLLDMWASRAHRLVSLDAGEADQVLGCCDELRARMGL